MNIKVCQNMKISFPQTIFWRSWLQFRLPRRKSLPKSENVLFIQLQKSQHFFRDLFFKRSSGDAQLSFDKFDEECLPDVGFYCSKFQIGFKRSLFWKKISFHKRSSGKVEWSAALKNLPKYAHHGSGNFPIEAGKNYRYKVLFYIFSSKGFVGIVGSDFAKHAEKCLPITDICLSNSVANYVNFLKSEML